MKNYKKLLPLALIVLMLLSCYSLVSNAISTKNEFDGYLKQGKAAAEKKISVDVDEAYENALKVKSLPVVYVKWVEYYESLPDYSMAVSLAETALETFPKSPEIYTVAMRNYLNIQDYELFFEAYNKCVALGATDKNVIDLYEKNKYSFSSEMETYGEAYPFSSGVSRVKTITYSEEEQGYYGYLAATGMINPQYIAAGDFNSDEISVAPVVNKDGEAFYINKEGQKKYDISPKGITVKKLGMYSSEVLTVFDGSKYYLCDIKSNIIAGPYDYITAFNNYIGAIKEDNKWKIVDTKGKQIVDATYDDIIIDSKEIVFRKGIFVKTDGNYYLINEKGEKVTDQSFEDARLFSDGMAAVKNNGLWGFIDSNGKLIIDYQFHDAKSFSGGFAPVKLNGKWGYIVYSEKDGVQVAIDYQFDDAIGFAQSPKVAMVKTGDSWYMIRLYI